MQTQSTGRRHGFNKSLEKFPPPEVRDEGRWSGNSAPRAAPAEGESPKPPCSLLPNLPCSAVGGKKKGAGNPQKYTLYISRTFPSLYKINSGFHLQRPHSSPSSAEAAANRFIVPPRQRPATTSAFEFLGEKKDAEGDFYKYLFFSQDSFARSKHNERIMSHNFRKANDDAAVACNHC